MKPQVKRAPRERISQILGAALELCCKRETYSTLTRETIADHAGIPASLITYHCGTMVNLRRAIMREAIRVECLPVIAQGIVSRDRRALKASPDLKQRALASL